jgi:sec-independent protein translocase protein TatC
MGDDSEPRGSAADDADAPAAAPPDATEESVESGDGENDANDAGTHDSGAPDSSGYDSLDELFSRDGVDNVSADDASEDDVSADDADSSTGSDDVDWTTFAAGEREADGTPTPTPSVVDSDADPAGNVDGDAAGDDGEMDVASEADETDAGFEFGAPPVDSSADADTESAPDTTTNSSDDVEADGVSGVDAVSGADGVSEADAVDDDPEPASERSADLSSEPAEAVDSADRTEPPEQLDSADPADSPDSPDAVAAESTVEPDAEGDVFFGDETGDDAAADAAADTAADSPQGAEADFGTPAVDERPPDARDAPATADEGAIYDPTVDDDDDLLEGPESDVEMPLADHIEEMVRRLGIVFVIAGVVGVFVFPVADDLVNFLWNTHIPGATTIESRRPRLYGPLELILTELKVASLAGFVVGLPVFVYQTYRFMRPGLYPRERKYYLAAVPTSLVLALIGVAFAHFVVLPAIFAYFTSYTIGTAVIAFGLKETFGLILVLMGYMALVFQIPLFIMLAIMMNLVTREWLTERRLLFWGGFLGLSFIVSPDPTGMAPIIIAATMIVLFEGTLLVLRWVKR